MHYYFYCNIKSIPPHHLAAVTEFQKRLQAYCDVHVICTGKPDFPKNVQNGRHKILVLTQAPSSCSSEELAKNIDSIQLSGVSTCHVLIGFSVEQIYELWEDISQIPTFDTLSLSRTSFSPETATILCLEQLYRGYTILQGKTYHK